MVLFMASAMLLVPATQAAVTVSPASFTLAAGQSLTLNIAGATSSGVKWSLSPAVGTVSGSTLSAVYHAPSTVTSGQTVQVVATTVATPTITVKALITLIPAITVAVSPAVADVVSNNQQTFTAKVVGSTNTAVTWSATAGSITSAGVYTAPTVTANTTATVTAAAQANTNARGTAQVRLHPKTGFWFTTQPNGLQSMNFNGIDYNYLYGENLVTSATTITSSGNVRGVPTCTGSFTATSVTKHCKTTGSDTIDVTVNFSSPPPAAGATSVPGSHMGTIQADIQLTNNSTTDPLSQVQLSIMGVSMTQWIAAQSSAGAVNGTNPIAIGNYGTGRWILWSNTPNPDLFLNSTCGWTYVCKNQPYLNNIAPGQTVAASFSLRFTDDLTSAPVALAPEAFAAFRAAYPRVVTWPDRRPIMAWFISDYNHQSATNPRGYLNDPTLDASNISTFKTKVLAQAQTVLSQIQARPVQPQGIIIWDLEGQEFIQPTTYVGDPRVLGQGYSPEMDATADSLFALFKNAGLKVGITLRPQFLQWGTSLPATCNYNTNSNYRDYYIKVDNPYQQRFYECYPNSTGTPAWTVLPHGNGGQTFYTPTQVQQQTALMLSKVQYAHSRWGTTLYYVDTSVWVGGTPLPQEVFRALEQAFPDCIFIPEENYAATMGVAMPYSDPKNSNAPKFAPLSWRSIYPTGAIGTYLSNCTGTCWTANVNSFDVGQKVGDIPIYAVPLQMSAAQLTTIESLITQARTESGSMTVTDSVTGTQYSYIGQPATAYPNYPLKMRVYFAATDSGLASSATYCESAGWLGTGTCSLNLTNLVRAQIRYYDFEDQLVITGSPQAR